MKHRIMCLLLTITFIFIALFSQSCIQGGDKQYYKWEPTEAEKKEIIERTAEKLAEQQEKELKE
ncbi:MAG: hypothetical protein ACYS6W_13445 [Planctomycetota bacterium]|jgi:hypothetical protein